MTGEILEFTGITTVPIPPGQMLESAKKWDLDKVIVVGADKDGNLVWGGSFAEVEMISWLLLCAHRELMEGALSDD